jgi:nucleoside-diphosphate-sugar epimerase
MSDKILITGATSFIGANLARRLVKDGNRVVILTRGASNRWRLEDVLSDLEDIVMPIEDAEGLKRAVKQSKPEVIFHLATAGLYGGRHLPEEELFRTNVQGTVNLIKACEPIDYKCFINTGSSSEYGPKDAPMKESDVCQPINAYGVSKCAATMYARCYAVLHKRNILNMRIFTPFGPYNDRFRLIAYVIDSVLKGKPLELASPDPVRDYIYIDDVVDLLIEASQAEIRPQGEVFNVGTGEQTSVAQVVETVMAVSGKEVEVRWGSCQPRDFDTAMWRADMTKTFKNFKWRPRVSFKEGIARNIAWAEGVAALPPINRRNI